MKREVPPAVIVGGLAVVAAAVLAIAFVNADLQDGESGATGPSGGAVGDDRPGDDATVIDVTTERYRFTPGSAEPINVTEGSVVVFRITSTDVTHGFAIQGYGVNEEIPPGQTVEVRFRATKAGSFTIYCTVFCGSGHPDHKGTLNVVPA